MIKARAAALIFTTFATGGACVAQPANNNPSAFYGDGQFKLPALSNPKDAYTILIDEGEAKPRRLTLPEGVHGLSILPKALPTGPLRWDLVITRATLPTIEIVTPSSQQLRAQDLDEGRVVVGWRAVKGAETYRIAGQVVDQNRASDENAWTKLSLDCVALGCSGEELGGNGFALKPGQQAKYKVVALDAYEVPMAQSTEMTATVAPGLARRAEQAGWKLQRSETLNKLLTQEGALFSWGSTDKEGAARSRAYRAEFAIIWEPPGEGYSGWFPRSSLEAALTSSGEQKGSDALRLRTGAYKIWKLRPDAGAEIASNLKYETERKTGTKKGLVELAVTPVFGWLGQYHEIGPRRGRNAIGNFATPPFLMVAPVATFAAEVGKTMDVGSSTETHDTIVRLKSTIRLDMEFPAFAAGLRLPRVGASLQATNWRLPRESDKSHSLGRGSLSFGLTPEVSFELSHSAGRDAPNFTFARVTSAGLGIKF